MRAINTIEPEAEAPVSSAYQKPEPAPAQLSLRAVTILEVVSVLFTVLLTSWVVVPLRLNNRPLEVIPALLALGLMLNSHRLRRETPGMLGFTASHFGAALKLLLIPMLVATAIILLAGYRLASLHFDARFWLSFTGRSVWGLLQQYILQAFIYRRVKFVLLSEGLSGMAQVARVRLAILIAASLFALVHAPNVPLMALTLIAGLLWTWVYERAPNLFALGLSHGLLSASAAASLPEWMIQGMVVGLRHLAYQAF